MTKRHAVVDLEQVEQFPHLPSAPIVEAVIQWRARAEKQWDPEAIKRDLLSGLPDYPECLPQHELFEANFSDNQSVRQERRIQWHGFRFGSNEHSYVSQFTRDGLIFSRLRPYNNWDRFSEEALKHWNIYRSLAEPSEVQRIGVRFINRIELTELSQVKKYLAQPPKCLDERDFAIEGFLYQSSHAVSGHPYRVNISRTIQPGNPPKSESIGLILDIDVMTTQSLDCETAGIEGHLASMRVLKNRVFFSLLRKSALKTFQRISK